MHADLINAAKILVEIDDRRPKQANLRRGISNAYYGLFHFLVDTACRSIVGTQHADKPHRNLLARAFSHEEMNRCCRSFKGGHGALPKVIHATVPTLDVSDATRAVSETFCALQQNRHDADYNLSVRFTRAECRNLIEETELVMAQFQSLPLDNSKRLFLSCLWCWDRIKGR